MIEAGTNPETTRKAPLAATGLPDFVLRQFKLGQPSHQQLYGILQAGIRDGSARPACGCRPRGCWRARWASRATRWSMSTNN
ncbi:hypothetical protein WJ968_26960 [Achromobacter xylosoxidans]